MARILLIEDDLTFSKILEGFLLKKDFTVTVTHSAKSGIDAFREKDFDLVLLDYRLPDMTGLEVLADIKAFAPAAKVLIMTGFSDIRTAVKAIKAGALEYITKPVNPDELLMMIQAALKKQIETSTLKEKLPVTKPLANDFIQGTSEVSKQLHKYIQLVAPTDMSVIIEGESGTGKEYVAQSIHRLSKRASAPFVAVDCGALSKELASSELFGHVKGAFTGAMSDKTGQFVAANGGTIFLDEVGNLSYEVQVKLLRAIQERIIQQIGSNKETKIDVRIITATNDELSESVKRGSFREDLYHRLNEFKLEVPPLRERQDDLMEFINHFHERAHRELNTPIKPFDKEVIDLFKGYDWPGNLRELKNTIRRAVLLSSGNSISVSTLPPEMLETVKRNAITNQPKETAPQIYDLKALQETHERELIIRTLEEMKYNKSKVARTLNIDRKTLYLKMEKYGID